MTTTCIFCGGGGPMSREHVFPRWMGDLFPDLGPVAFGRTFVDLVGNRKGIKDEWTAKAFSQTVSVVCATCNNGWLSDVENRAKDVITDLILDRPRHLSVLAQYEVAVWATKTVLVATLTMPRPLEIIASEHFSRFYEEKAPLVNSLAWLARYDGRGEFPTTFKLHGSIHVPVENGAAEFDPDAPAAFHAVFSVGHIVFIVFALPNGPLVDGSSNSTRCLIWPSAMDSWWPPEDTLSEADLKIESEQLPE